MGKGLEDLEILQLTEAVADGVWQQVFTWKSFSQDTVGKQLTRSVDLIGANIVESFGRFHFAKKVQFLYYARGSLFEAKYWLNRCASRALNENGAQASRLHTANGTFALHFHRR